MKEWCGCYHFNFDRGFREFFKYLPFERGSGTLPFKQLFLGKLFLFFEVRGLFFPSLRWPGNFFITMGSSLLNESGFSSFGISFTEGNWYLPNLASDGFFSGGKRVKLPVLVSELVSEVSIEVIGSFVLFKCSKSMVEISSFNLIMVNLFFIHGKLMIIRN